MRLRPTKRTYSLIMLRHVTGIIDDKSNNIKAVATKTNKT